MESELGIRTNVRIEGHDQNVNRRGSRVSGRRDRKTTRVMKENKK